MWRCSGDLSKSHSHADQEHLSHEPTDSRSIIRPIDIPQEPRTFKITRKYHAAKSRTTRLILHEHGEIFGAIRGMTFRSRDFTAQLQYRICRLSKTRQNLNFPAKCLIFRTYTVFRCSTALQVDKCHPEISTTGAIHIINFA